MIMILTPTKTIRQAKRRVSRLARQNPLMSPWALVGLAAAEIRQAAPELAQRLAPALLKGWVTAALELARDAGVPKVSSPPPPPPEPGLARFGPDPVRWPAIESAVKDLVSRDVVTWPEYQALSEQAQATAFTTARVLTEDGIDRVRQAIAETVADGKTQKQFIREVGGIMANAGLGTRQIETIFRTSVGQAQAAGQRALLKHPTVAAEFPYVAYYAVHDSRTGDRIKGLPGPTHLMMETLGIQGTNIYRADDPVILKFWAPWRWNCRCQCVLISIEDAAAAGVREAKDWMRTGRPPITPTWVAHPPFDLPRGWPRGAGTGIRPIVP